jgi:hypothetical protein
MCTCDRRHFVLGSLLSMGVAGLAGTALAQAPADGKKYVCPPCGCDMDGKPVAGPGVCAAAGCGMPLIEYKPPASGGDPKAPQPPAPAPKAPVPAPG